MRWFIRVFLILILLTLIGFSTYQYTQITSLKNEVAQIKDDLKLPSAEMFNGQLPMTNETQGNCESDCKQEIEKVVADAFSKISITPIVTTVHTTNSTKQTTYVSLGSGSTMSQDWYTLEDSAIVMDLENDYSKTATVSWEASLKVSNGNGTVYTRLYDATHNIAVDGSEFSTENNQVYKHISSKNLPFWKGRNTYKVQIKSLNGFEVYISGARLKIQY